HPYLIESYLPGVSAEKWIQEGGPARPEDQKRRLQALQIVRGTLVDLQFLHGKGYAYGDMKAANVQVLNGSQNGSGALIDFGNTTKVRHPQAPGSPTYAADLMGVARVLYQLLTNGPITEFFGDNIRPETFDALTKDIGDAGIVDILRRATTPDAS